MGTIFEIVEEPFDRPCELITKKNYLGIQYTYIHCNRMNNVLCIMSPIVPLET